MPTSAGSIALATFHPARDAFMVGKLKAAGAVILGKTNMHELAAGIVTVGSRFGQTKNPYDLDRNPGGSSGGTGAAVAASFAAAGMGSDTCGSIRNPASHNNLVGLRGTQGLSSRTGIVPLSSTQDIGGPIARSIVDLAIMLDATVGADPADATTPAAAGHIPTSYRSALRADGLKGARIGVVRTLFGNAPDDQEVTAVVQRAIEELKKAGADRKAEAARVLERIAPKMDILENQSYHRRLLMYKGLEKPEALLDTTKADDTTIATQGYGVGNYYLVTGRAALARDAFQRVVAGGGWNAFGFIAAEADLARK